MKLYTIQTSAGSMRVAASHSMDSMGWDITSLFPSLLDVIRGGEEALQTIAQEIKSKTPDVNLNEVTILAPIPEPIRNVYCVGWNYLKHFNEGIGRRGDQEVELPQYPTFFTKSTRAVIGPNMPIPYDSGFSERWDYEAEIAVIIGRSGININEHDAMSHVFGYTLANDVSARDVQRRHGGQWLKGKSMDGSCPLGPAIVTKDEIPEVQDLTIRCEINGETRQEARLTQLIFSIPRLIQDLSQAMTLLPGDILLTGTPDGVGFGRTPPVYLQPGDTMVVSSEQLGQLVNVVGPDLKEKR